jgi:hypothetical protein
VTETMTTACPLLREMTIWVAMRAEVVTPQDVWGDDYAGGFDPVNTTLEPIYPFVADLDATGTKLIS